MQFMEQSRGHELYLMQVNWGHSCICSYERMMDKCISQNLCVTVTICKDTKCDVFVTLRRLMLYCKNNRSEQLPESESESLL